MGPGPIRAGRATFRVLRDAVTAADAAHPNTAAPGALAVRIEDRSEAFWLRVFNAAAGGAPSVTFTLFGRRTGGDWSVLGLFNAGAAVSPSTTPGGGPALAAGLQRVNLFDITERIVGAAAWDELWVGITGTLNSSVSVHLGYEEH